MMHPPNSKPLALILAAGTGGHIMPGLAIAEVLSAKDWSVQWLGTQHGMENKLVPAAGLVLHGLNFAGLRGKGAFGFIRGTYRLILAVLAARALFKKLRPSVLVGMGGYICVPAAWAARSLSIPLVLVNADADLLLSNRTLASQALAVCCGFEGSAAKLDHAVITGNPVRAAMTQLPPPELRFAERGRVLNVLIVGGSLGAKVLNETVPQALTDLQSRGLQLKITHQTGVNNVASTQAAYQSLRLEAQVLPFIDDMAMAYGLADVVICRAGAITVSELCAVGVPAILVPFLASTTHHQAGNAEYLQGQGAGVHLPQAQFTSDTLVSTIESLLGLPSNSAIAAFSRNKLLAMATAAQRLSRSHASQAVVETIEKVVLNP